MPPDKKFFAFSGSQIGAWVVEVFLHPDEFIGKDLKLVVEWISTREMAETASRVTGLNVRPLECTMEDLERTQKKGHIYVDLYRMSMYYIMVSITLNIEYLC